MKRLHKKSRLGCNDCKRRRVKCDGLKPSCQNCIRNKLKCSFVFLVPAVHRGMVFRHKDISSSSSPPESRSSQPSSPISRQPSLHSDLCLNPSPLDIKSLELIHHYTSNTCASLTTPKGVEVWRLAIPSMAIAHPFLMHGMLALSALHLAFLQPHRKLELSTKAFASESAALPRFREFLAENKPQNIHVIFAFSSFVIPYMLVVSGLFEKKGRIPSFRDGEPHWFYAMRGTVVLLVNNWPDISAGPFRTVMDQTPHPIDYSRNPSDMHLARLHAILIPHASASVEEVDSLATCRSALDELRRVSALPYSPSRAVVLAASIFVWPGTVSQEYLKLLDERRPEALIILAHYCVLINRVNSIWYLFGAGVNLLAVIDDALSEEWKPWIQWALEQPVASHYVHYPPDASESPGSLHSSTSSDGRLGPGLAF